MKSVPLEWAETVSGIHTTYRVIEQEYHVNLPSFSLVLMHADSAFEYSTYCWISRKTPQGTVFEISKLLFA